jgi:hypothetical protein
VGVLKGELVRKFVFRLPLLKELGHGSAAIAGPDRRQRVER